MRYSGYTAYLSAMDELKTYSVYAGADQTIYFHCLGG